jgi:ParB-like chromosome segregation protein Spo0J
MMNRQPISTVEWVKRDSIEPNNYNPNKQPIVEFRLLKISLLEDGWTQPIVVFDDGSGGKPVIVDGEHRWKTSADTDIAELTEGFVPIVRIVKSRSDLMMSTIRHNRARGEHAVLDMSKIVNDLLADNVSVDDICLLLGMEDEEVERLSERAGLPEVISRGKHSFSKGWSPK